MSNSETLSSNKNLSSTKKNTESKNQEVKLSSVVEDLLETFKKEYPDLEFGYQAKYSCEDLSKKQPETSKCKDTCIKPDGGFVYVVIDKQRRYILVSEQKKQGTNDKRTAKNEIKQAQGNAVERLGKNVKAFDMLFRDEDIYPFVSFIQGCDFFDKESTIGDRVRTINCWQDINKINLYWQKIGKHLSVGGSYFMRGHSMHEKTGTSDWTYEEMYSICYKIMKESLEYYRKTYGDLKNGK